MTHYREHDPIMQGLYYTRHVEAMTAEGLHSKGAIASELAARDIQIDTLAADRDQISLTLAVAKADRDKWFNRARDLEKALRFCQFYMTDVKFPTDHPMTLAISKALTTPETTVEPK